MVGITKRIDFITKCSRCYETHHLLQNRGSQPTTHLSLPVLISLLGTLSSLVQFIKYSTLALFQDKSRLTLYVLSVTLQVKSILYTKRLSKKLRFLRFSSSLYMTLILSHTTLTTLIPGSLYNKNTLFFTTFWRLWMKLFLD